MNRRSLLAGLAGALTSASSLPRPAAAHGYTLGDLSIGHPWSRAAIAGSTGAGFLSVTNKGAAADRLIGARAAYARKVELHTHLMDNGVMRMREVEGGIPLPPGEKVELKPGGFHIMLIGLSQPLKAGERAPLTLVFETAGEIEVELAVEAAGRAPAQHQHS